MTRFDPTRTNASRDFRINEAAALDARNTTANTPAPCRFEFDSDGDEPSYNGFSSGETWNGWDVVLVTPETRDEIVAWLTAEPGNEEAAAELSAAPTNESGLIRLDGYTTSIIAKAEGGAK